MESVITLLHASPIQCSLAVTGAGGTAISQLLAVAGCSRTLITAEVPYHQDAARLYTDHQCPKKFLSMDLALDLAHHAFRAKCKNVVEQTDLLDESVTSAAASTPAALPTSVRAPPIFVGVGSSAAVRTERSRRGEDGAYIATWSEKEAICYHLLLNKELSRSEQETKISAAIIFAITRCDADLAAKVPAADLFLGGVGLSLKVRRHQEAGAHDDDKEDDVEEDVLLQQIVPIPQSLASCPFLHLLVRSNVVSSEQPATSTKRASLLLNAHRVPRFESFPFTSENVDTQQSCAYFLCVGEDMDNVSSSQIKSAAHVNMQLSRSVVVTRHVELNLEGAMSSTSGAEVPAAVDDDRSRIMRALASAAKKRSLLFGSSPPSACRLVFTVNNSCDEEDSVLHLLASLSHTFHHHIFVLKEFASSLQASSSISKSGRNSAGDEDANRRLIAKEQVETLLRNHCRILFLGGRGVGGGERDDSENNWLEKLLHPVLLLSSL